MYIVAISVQQEIRSHLQSVCLIQYRICTLTQSKTILEKALAQDPGYTEAVCLLAEITSVRKQQQEYEKITTL